MRILEGILAAAALAPGCVSLAAGPARTALVKGLVVRLTDGTPVEGARVALLTGRPEIDYPETVARLGGKGAIGPAAGFLEGKVAALGGWRPGLTATSDRDGAFAIPVPADLPPFRFEVEADFAVYPEMGPWFALGSPEVEEAVFLSLHPAGRIEGTVRSAGGRPAAGARVAVMQPEVSLTNPGTLPLWKTVADGDGKFAIGGVLPGLFVAAAVAEGCGVAVVPDLFVREGESLRVDISLPPESFVEGRVVDRQGRPIAGASVDVRRDHRFADALSESPFRPISYFPVTTDEEGRFRARSLVAGRHQVLVEKAGFRASAPHPLDLGSDGVGGLRIVLERGASVAGRVLDSKGRPVPRAWVSVQGPPGAVPGRLSWQWGVSDEEGSIRLSGLEWGPLLVQAWADGKGWALAEHVAPGTAGLRLRLGGTATLAGKVTDGAAVPVHRFSVRTNRIEPSPVSVRWDGVDRPVATKEGTFEFADLVPGTYEVVVRADGFLPARIERVALTPGGKGRVEVSLERGGAIRGRVVEGSAPVPAAIVRAFPVGLDSVNRGDSYAREAERTGPDGRFEVRGLPPGEWMISAGRAGFLGGRSAAVEVGPSETREEVVVRLSRIGGLEGVAVDDEGKPIADTWVRAVVLSKPQYGAPRRLPGSVRTDSDGRFRIEGLPPNWYEVSVDVPEERNAGRARLVLATRASVGEGAVRRIEIPPRRETSLRGWIFCCGEGVSDRSVEVIPARLPEDFTEKERLLSRLRGATGADGSFAIERVPIGEAEIRVPLPDRTFVSSAVRLENLPEWSMEFDLPLGEIRGRVARASDGTPVAGATVGCEGPHFAEATTDAEGFYRFPLLRPNPYRLRVFRRDDLGSGFPKGALAVAIRDPLLVRAGEKIHPDFVLFEAGSVVVCVSAPDGRPASMAPVVLVPKESPLDPCSVAGLETRCAEDGVAFLKGVLPARYVAVAGEPSGLYARSAEFAVAPGIQSVVALELVPATRVAVRLEPSDRGTSAIDPRVYRETVFVDGEGVETPALSSPMLSCGLSRWEERYPALQPGEYVLRVRVPGFRPFDLPVRVERRPKQEVLVRLEREERPR